MRPNFNANNKRRPAYARSFKKFSDGRSVLLIIGSWNGSQWLPSADWKSYLCVPPGDDPFAFDWSILRGQSVVVLTYCPIDAKAFAITLRAIGVLDVSVYDCISGKILYLAYGKESEQSFNDTARVLAEIRKGRA